MRGVSHVQGSKGVAGSLAFMMVSLSLGALALDAGAPTASATPGDLVATLRFSQDCASGLGTGITFDGTNLWYSCYNNAPDLFRADPTTGVVTGSWNVAHGLGSIAFDAARNVIWAGPGGGGFSGWAVEIPLDNSKSVSGAYLPGIAVTEAANGGCGGLDDGIAIDGIADVLYVSFDCSHNVYKYAAGTGAYLGSIPWGGAGCYNSGVAIGGDLLYEGADGCNHAWVVDKTSLAAQFDFATTVAGDSNFRDEGLTCDTHTFAAQGKDVMWSKEAYSPMRAAAFEIPPSTCGVGGQAACVPLVGVSVVDPAVGFDYYGASKTAQSPLLTLPRMSGVVTLAASTTDASKTARVDFLVDGALVGSDTTAPYQASWDASTVGIGAHSVTVRAVDTAGCQAVAAQAFQTTCGAPIGVSITRPAAGFAYSADAPHPGDPGLALVIGDVTVQAAASDPARIASVAWSADGGAPFATGVVGAPWSALWQASLLSPGIHHLEARFTETDARCSDVASIDVRVATLTLESTSRALFATTLQPGQPTLQSEGASYPDRTTTTFRDQVFAPAGLRAQFLRDTADQAASSAQATSEVANVSLLGGVVQATLLHADARASFDAPAFLFALDPSGSFVNGVTVNGVPVIASQPNTVVPIPGVGSLVLDERITDARNTHVELRVNALHLYVDHDGIRSETIVAQAVAGADVAGAPYRGRVHDVDPQDDAGTGADAGNTLATATPLAVGASGDVGTLLVGGRVGGGLDATDVYTFPVQEGEKLEVVLKPAERVTVTTHTMPTPPAVGGASLDTLDATPIFLELLDPNAHAVTLRSSAPLSAPQRIELNVNESGDWILRLSGAFATNYTLSVTVTPIVLAAQAPAGAACGDTSAPLLGSAPVANMLHAQDTIQVYQMHAAIGDNLAVVLSMPDLDGQNFDLVLYDDACNVLSQSHLGSRVLWDGDVPKGVSDFVEQLPALYTGTYFVEVSRVVGAGNYVLSPYAGSAIPTAPNNDALTGSDASDDVNAPTPLPLPDGVFEGRFEDGDARDVYSFTIQAGDAMVVTFEPSPTNTGIMTVNGGGAQVQGSDVFGHATFTIRNRATTAQTIVLVMTPTTGGGNYLFSVAHAGGA